MVGRVKGGVEFSTDIIMRGIKNSEKEIQYTNSSTTLGRALGAEKGIIISSTFVYGTWDHNPNGWGWGSNLSTTKKLRRNNWLLTIS